MSTDKHEPSLGGDNEDAIAITELESSQAVRLALAQQANTSIHIFEANLRDEIYHSTAFIDALRTLVATDTRAIVKILINDIDQAMNNAPQVFSLSRRVPSHIQIRLSPTRYHHSFFVADTTGYLDHRMGSGYEAEAHFNHPARAKSLISFFDEVWNRSRSAQESQNITV